MSHSGSIFATVEPWYTPTEEEDVERRLNPYKITVDPATAVMLLVTAAEQYANRPCHVHGCPHCAEFVGMWHDTYTSLRCADRSWVEAELEVRELRPPEYLGELS